MENAHLLLNLISFVSRKDPKLLTKTLMHTIEDDGELLEVYAKIAYNVAGKKVTCGDLIELVTVAFFEKYIEKTKNNGERETAILNVCSLVDKISEALFDRRTVSFAKEAFREAFSISNDNFSSPRKKMDSVETEFVGA